MSRQNNTTKVFVAMSGGVDSSVAAFLLVRQGYDVTGVYMKPWQPKGITCLWQEERADALRVAAQLGIPLETWDVSARYARDVARPMVRAYRDGRTPNPDIECNRHIKFGLFYDRAMRRGASFVATGHYARIGQINEKRNKRETISCYLWTAKDKKKDQSYFLWTLRSEQLSHILFPVGAMLKTDVRALARKEHIVTAQKKDSQGVCFVGPMDMKSFLKTAIRPKRGVIRHIDGRVLGSHDGAGYYTIGQRHGLDIGEGGGPYFVIEKSMRRNTITVGPAARLKRSVASLGAVHWIGRTPTRGEALRARIRYRGVLIPVTLTGRRIRFLKPASAVAPGQSVVLYRGAEVLGGAILR